MDDQRLTSHSSVGEVIAALTAASGGSRDLRAALTHIDAELGTMPVGNVRTRHVAALLDDLEDAGISPRREAAVVDALDSLFAFARNRGLVRTDPLAGAVADEHPDPRPKDPPLAAVTPSGPATATATMLALGTRVASWAAVAILVLFVLLLALLLAELA